MRDRNIGTLAVGEIGLGAMPLSIEGRPDEARAIATIHAALDAGVTLIDTADSYYRPGEEPGHNELLIARALAGYAGSRDSVHVTTKGGRARGADGSWLVLDSPAALKRACEDSLARLGVESIALYQLHKPPLGADWDETLGVLDALHTEGKIQRIGLSNVDATQISRAHELLGDRLASVQNRYSPEVLFDASIGSAADVRAELRLCEELGLAFLPWSPLGGISRSSLDGPSGQRSDDRYAAFHRIAAAHGVSPQRVCLAWLLATSPVVIPIPGASRPETIRDSAAASTVILSAAELAELDGSGNPPR
ncbi:aldo/keto reductase [Stackebrandtia nassauensis]|uniref:aldo/keto reductase n=1 Tax=Stackebrandtia nassauensis TaxID=283811 RepID=UPI000A049764|nr:aldo/keto reductase [Stackebrandtia nassauensis]